MKTANPSTYSLERLIPNPKAKLLDQVREVIRFKHYSIRTEQAYIHWIKRFIFFHQKRHPREMGAGEIQAFLTHLAAQQHVAASTQNQALNALVFLYRKVLNVQPGEFGEFERAKRPAKLPVVLSKEETQRLLAAMKPGTLSLMARAGTAPPSAPSVHPFWRTPQLFLRNGADHIVRNSPRNQQFSLWPFAVLRRPLCRGTLSSRLRHVGLFDKVADKVCRQSFQTSPE